MRRTAIIIPCYNEALRLDGEGMMRLLRHDDVRIIFIDDGSSDETIARLRQLEAKDPTRIEVVHLPCNVGKGASVRFGMLKAIAAGAEVVGYLDADLATPAEELLRMYELFEASEATVLLGSRVKLLGYDIARHAWRHYLGRLFATMASLTLGMPVYDTQCGAKLFRVGPALEAALARPFHSRWIFDVELIGRLHRGLAVFREVPLYVWRDVRGSKLGPLSAARAVFDLLVIAVVLRLGGARRS